jgi:translocator protein
MWVIKREFLGGWCLLICYAAAAIASIPIISNTNTEWYALLCKPSFYPAGWVFVLAWTVLYTLMAVALYHILRASPSPQRTLALRIFAVQLALNVIWSYLFFQFHFIGLSFLEILLLLISLFVFYISVWPVSRWAAWCFLPYIVWVVIAAILNGTILFLNNISYSFPSIRSVNNKEIKNEFIQL